MEAQIKMISAASKVLSFRKHSPLAIDEEVFQHVSDYISKEKIKNEEIKFAMIAAASEAFKISRENPKMSEKDILRKVMEKIPSIIQRLDFKN